MVCMLGVDHILPADGETSNPRTHAVLHKALAGALKRAYVGIATATQPQGCLCCCTERGKAQGLRRASESGHGVPEIGRITIRCDPESAGLIGDERSTSIHHASLLFPLSDLQGEKGFRLCRG